MKIISCLLVLLIVTILPVCAEEKTSPPPQDTPIIQDNTPPSVETAPPSPSITQPIPEPETTPEPEVVPEPVKEEPPVTKSSSMVEEIVNPATLTKEQSDAIIREKILANPAALNLLHRAGFQIADILDLKWQLSPLKVGKLIRVDRARQRVFVFQDGLPIYIFKCSTCANGIVIPVGAKGPEIHEHIGIFSVLDKEKCHISKEYHGIKMPYALRYVQGHFIHETTIVRRLGHRASHGCVRLNRHDAITLFRFAHVGIPVEER